MREEGKPSLWRTLAFAGLQGAGYALGLTGLLYRDVCFAAHSAAGKSAGAVDGRVRRCGKRALVRDFRNA